MEVATNFEIAAAVAEFINISDLGQLIADYTLMSHISAARYLVKHEPVYIIDMICSHSRHIRFYPFEDRYRIKVSYITFIPSGAPRLADEIVDWIINRPYDYLYHLGKVDPFGKPIYKLSAMLRDRLDSDLDAANKLFSSIRDDIDRIIAGTSAYGRG